MDERVKEAYIFMLSNNDRTFCRVFNLSHVSKFWADLNENCPYWLEKSPEMNMYCHVLSWERKRLK